MSIKRIRYLLIVFAACALSRLHADEITVRRIPVARDLPSNTVYRVFRDGDGFVWFGTTNGFCRYDGYDMKSFRSEIADPAFPSNYVTGGFAEDKLNHTLWIGTEKGVLILDKRTHEIRLPDTAAFIESPVRRMLCSDAGMWVCSDAGLYLYPSDGSSKRKYLASANDIHVDDKGTVRVTVLRGGMYRLDRESDRFLPYPPVGEANNPHKIFRDAEGRFWVCTWGDGLYRFYPDGDGRDGFYERISCGRDAEGNSFDIFFGMEQDDVNGYIWALSCGGLIVFKPEGDRIVPATEISSPINDLTNLFSDIIKDDDGNLWLGTYEQGAIMVDPGRSSVGSPDLQFIKNRTGYVPDIVKVFEDGDGELWLKQNRLGVFLFDPATSAVRRLDIPDNNAANAICRHSAADEIWVAADYAPNIYRLRKSNGRVTFVGTIDAGAILDGRTQPVKFLHEDGNGTMWAATNEAVVSYRRGEWTVVEGDCGTITGIAEDSYGTVWIATAERGLLQVVRDGDETGVRSLDPVACPVGESNVSLVAAGREGELWLVVNEKRLLRYDVAGHRTTDYTRKANVDDFVIFNIVAGDNGHVWISSDKLIVEFNPQTGASVRYDAWEDLSLTSLHGGSMTQTRNGSIVSGGNNGICILTPSSRPDLPCKKVKTVVTDVKINGKSIYGSDANRKSPDWRRKLVLLPGETNLEIDFSSFNYRNPGKTRYAYKLEGVDRQWIHTEPGRGFAVYNQLRKGEYSFLVKSTGDNQLWSDETTRMLVIKKPALHETAAAYVCYALATLTVLFAGLRFYANRIKLRNELRVVRLDKEKSEELIQTKLRFFTNIGHEFRTPLTLIVTPLNTLINQTTDEGLKHKLSAIRRNAEEMLGLINQLLDFRKLETGGEQLKLSCDDFVKFAEYVYYAFRDVATSRAISFTFESEVTRLFMSFDKGKIRKTINNLYSNALKFTPDEGFVATTVRLVVKDGREFVRLDVADSGCGVPEHERQAVFERFYRCENNDSDKTGTGIGLHLVKEYVELHGGQVTLDGKPGEGSVFSVFIPSDLQVSETAARPGDAIETDSANSSPANRNRERKTVLLVEDNVELRHFLAEQLEGKFTVLQAANGTEGAEEASTNLPDLIVSDLMMPGLNGAEMCRRLKTDIRTSHIPVVLLTARVSDESKIESYKAGADSYISKPFNFEVLQTRMEMLIEQQENRGKLFRKTIEITPSSITTTSLDEELMRKALLAVEKNMDNTEYSVDELASELALSRRHLSRKFQSIVGLSPGEFVRSVRLKRAAQLLKDSQYNVSEIADMVGFNTIKYFNRHFKTEFGKTPTQYRKNSD